MIKDLLGILGILLLLVEIYLYVRRYWLGRLLENKKKEKRTRKPPVLRPKSERDCQFCREEKGNRRSAKREIPISWQLRKGRGGRKKKILTEGYFCPNKSCEYYGITEEAIHALVGYGVHGTNEVSRHAGWVDQSALDGKGVVPLSFAVMYRLNKGERSRIFRVQPDSRLGFCREPSD